MPSFLLPVFITKPLWGQRVAPLSWMFCERFIRKAAGLGKASRNPDPDSYDIAYSFYDILVIGAGPAGLHAAARLAEQGHKILLVEQDFEAGGSYLASGEASDIAVRDTALKRLEKAGSKLMLGPRPLGYMMGWSWGTQNAGPIVYIVLIPIARGKSPILFIPGRLYWPRGAAERGLAFGNNDRPGVCAGRGATCLCRYGVMAGKSAVLATCHMAPMRMLLRWLGSA